MDNIRRCNSPFFQDLPQYSFDKIDRFDYQNNTLHKLEVYLNNNTIEDIISMFFNDLHNYLYSNNLLKENTPCCFAHSLFNIQYTKNPNHLNSKLKEVTKHNLFVYNIESSFFQNVWSPLGHFCCEINDEQSEISDIQVNDFVIIHIKEPQKITKEQFQHIFDEGLLVHSKNLVIENKNSKSIYYSINRIIYENNSGAYSLLIQKEEEKEWISYEENKIKFNHNDKSARCINSNLFEKRFLPILLILQKNNNKNDVVLYDQKKKEQIDKNRSKSQ